MKVMKKIILLFTLLFVVLKVKSQDQRDSLLVPKSDCLPNNEEIEVFVKKSEMFGLYLHLTGICDGWSLTYSDRRNLTEWLSLDSERELIEKLSPKGKDTILFKHSRTRIMTTDSTWYVAYPWTHTPLSRKERKEADKEVMVLLNGHEILALFHLFASYDTYYRPRLFKVLRQNYCTYASYKEVKEWLQYYKSNFSNPHSEYFLQL